MDPSLLEFAYDAVFDRIPNLTWRPWVGERWRCDKPVPRVLIVGESHYSRRDAGISIEETVARHKGNRDFTREIIWECPVSQEWKNPTLNRIAPLLLGDGAYDRASFWRDVAFFNLVQRPLKHLSSEDAEEGEPAERPTAADYELGWSIFPEIVEAIDPDVCLFLGTSSRPYLGQSMQERGIMHGSEKSEKIGRCWGYSGMLTLKKKGLRLLFVQHPGRYFSTPMWHEFVLRECPDLATFQTHQSLLASG